MFDSLGDRLQGIAKRLRGKGRLTEADVDEVLASLVVHQLVDPLLERVERSHEVDSKNYNNQAGKESVENAEANLHDATEHRWPVLRVAQEGAGRVECAADGATDLLVKAKHPVNLADAAQNHRSLLYKVARLLH